MAKLSADMKNFVGAVKKVKIVDEKGNLFNEDNNDKCFLKPLGHTNIKENSTFRIHRAIPTISGTPWVISVRSIYLPRNCVETRTRLDKSSFDC